MPAKILSAMLLTGMLVSAADTRLADAAQNSDRNTVRSLLAQKVDVNAPQGDGTTALHWAAFNDDLDMAKLLVAAGANVKSATRVGSITPLFMACKNGNAAMIGLFLNAGADPNATDEHGTTALMTAAASGGADAVKTLVEHGADVNAREGAHGQTALMFAASLNRAAAIKVLMEYRADPGVTTKAVKLPKPPPRFDDGTPVLEAKDSKPAQTPSGAAAADQKASLDALAASMGLKSAVVAAGGKPGEGDLKDLVEKLSAKMDAIEKRLPADKPKEDANNGNGGNGQFGIVRERGTTDIGGMTALLFAARDGQVDAARALLEGGANINQVSTSEKTSPLVLAIMNGHLDLAKFLSDWGADPNLANTQGLTALYAAIDVQWAPKGWFPAAGTAQEKISYLGLMKALLDDGAESECPARQEAVVPFFRRPFVGRHGRRHRVLARRPIHRRGGDEAAGGARRRSGHSVVWGRDASHGRFRHRLGVPLQHERARFHLDGRGEILHPARRRRECSRHEGLHCAARRRLHRQSRVDQLSDGARRGHEGGRQGQEHGRGHGKRPDALRYPASGDGGAARETGLRELAQLPVGPVSGRSETG